MLVLSCRKRLANGVTSIWTGPCWDTRSSEAIWRSSCNPMNHEHHHIGAAATRLADRLPHSVMISVAGAVAQNGHLDPAAARHSILQCAPTPDFRDATADFLDHWHTHAPSVGEEAVAVALVTPDEIVWTGPEPAETRFRQTEQAILEVVNTATKRLTVVSYAVYRIPRIREALVAAANRGVGIRLIVETPNRIEGQGEYDCLLALGDNVASACSDRKSVV